MSSYYSNEELNKLGFKSIGQNVQISKKCSIYGANNMTIGSNVRIDDFTMLSGEINIGNFVHISAYTALYGKFGIEIGDYCGCSPRCTILSGSDDFSGNFMISPMAPEEYTNVFGKKVVLKNFVQLGANSIIMPGVVVNEGAVCAAFSFVKQDIDSWTMVGGIPAKYLKNREKKITEYVKIIKETQQ